MSSTKKCLVRKNADKLVFALEVLTYYFERTYGLSQNFPEMKQKFESLRLVKEAQRYSESVDVSINEFYKEYMTTICDPRQIVQQHGRDKEDMSSWIDCFNKCAIFRKGMIPMQYMHSVIHLAVSAVVFFDCGVPEAINLAIFTIASDLSKDSNAHFAIELFTSVVKVNKTDSTSMGDDMQPKSKQETSEASNPDVESATAGMGGLKVSSTSSDSNKSCPSP